MITKRGPKLLYSFDFISVHGAPPENSFVQNITNPIGDVPYEGFFSNVPPGQDEIRKVWPIRAEEDRSDGARPFPPSSACLSRRHPSDLSIRRPAPLRQRIVILDNQIKFIIVLRLGTYLRRHGLVG